MFGKRNVRALLLLLAISVLSSNVSNAQQTNTESADIGVNFLGALNGSLTTGNSPSQPNPSNTVGGMIEFRFLIHRWVGFEGTYSYRQPSQDGPSFAFPPFGSPQTSGLISYSTHAQQITGDWVFSKKTARFTYFALAGLGGLFTTVPTGEIGTQSSANLAYEYGGGLDWKLRPRFGVRLQYRGDISKTPAISQRYPSNSGYMHTAEPMIGLYYRWF